MISFTWNFRKAKTTVTESKAKLAWCWGYGGGGHRKRHGDLWRNWMFCILWRLLHDCIPFLKCTKLYTKNGQIIVYVNYTSINLQKTKEVFFFLISTSRICSTLRRSFLQHRTLGCGGSTGDKCSLLPQTSINRLLYARLGSWTHRQLTQKPRKCHFLQPRSPWQRLELASAVGCRLVLLREAWGGSSFLHECLLAHWFLHTLKICSSARFLGRGLQ